MRHFTWYLNAFILTGVALLFISIAGLVRQDFLTEPGQPANPLAWLWYLVAAVIMLVNGYVSIRMAMQQAPEPAAATSEEEAEA